jgi:leucyl/phenylalanyl-tRNA---protein transferase
MPVFKLSDGDFSFPDPDLAESNGLLAVGTDLDPRRLIVAYQQGIFPWFKEEGLFYWFAPDPRCVLFFNDLKIHKSMRSIFNQQKFRYTLDTCFEQVMHACANTPRQGASEASSWIEEDFLQSYSTLHQLGVAHSVEVWENDELVGGLYGLSIGKIFFGDSMFSKKTNASKAGFITLARALQQTGFQLIDCQIQTPHLESLGAKGISRTLFTEYLDANFYERTLVGKWRFSKKGGVELAVDLR